MGAPGYQEHAPAPALRSYVSCYWSSEAVAGQTTAHLVLPDGCIDLLFARSSAGSSLVCVGAMQTAQWVRGAGPSVHLGVRFHPGGAAALMGARVDALTDGSVDAESVIGNSAKQLHQDLLAAPSLKARVVALDGFLLRCRRAWPDVDPRVQQAAIGLQRGIGIDPLAGEVGLSRQHLRRLFLAHTGLSPKMFARVLRLERALCALRSGTAIVSVACDAGFSDQAHLNREFRSLTGQRPTTFAGGNEGVPFVQDRPGLAD